jgi:CDP-L-myo-inositol myo-inositolphosphotransferase
VLEESIRQGKNSLSDGIEILAKRGKMRYFDIKEALWIDIDSMRVLKNAEKMLPRIASKHGTIHGIITRYLNRYLHEPLVRLFAKTSITPNAVTVLAFLASLSAMLFFIFAHPIWAGLFIQLSSILDGADGKLARIKFKTSSFGGILDSFLDLFADFVIFFGMGWFSFQHFSDWLSWFFAFLAFCGTIAVSVPAAISIPFGIYSVSLSKLYRCVPFKRFQKWDKLIVEVSPACKDARFLYLALGSILNLVFPTLIFIAVTTNLLAIYRLLRAFLVLRYLREDQIKEYLKKLGGWS